ncbi:uncharacterized protein LOC122853938 [Aphidius gifuensis]|uniref:uncharacterized protein LOC122853938 n=1 Tax=Aphidius gifuensis TaxID=684658 RepID=UPI001CDB73D1|nr:uncharacterized protein LOC122853938 [Aphidius gifuensis]
MNDARIRFITRKRAALKSQLTRVQELFDEGEYEALSLRARVTRVSELYNNYEELNDEIAISQPDHPHLDEFNEIQDRYFTLLGKINEALNITQNLTPRESLLSVNEIVPNEPPRRRTIKLPQITLPTFDGKYSNWLNFKTEFLEHIGELQDLSDGQKFQYLKQSLIGDAKSKVHLFTATRNNYHKAWEILNRAYEVKRILIKEHLAKLTKLPVQRDENTEGLVKLADEVQQNAENLKNLGVSISSEMLVHLIEDKLHKKTCEKWEESLKRDEFPTIDEMYEFLYRTAVCVSKRTSSDVNKSDLHKGQPATKKPRLDKPNPVNHSFVIQTSNNCTLCKDQQHPLFRCEKFRNLEIKDRVNVVKNAKLCYNCLRYHRDVEYKACTLKTLGISWQIKDDNITYNVNSIKTDKKLTKRHILSEIAKIFDPLGLLGPIILHAKVIMQKIWKEKLHWDESVPPEIHRLWLKNRVALA